MPSNDRLHSLNDLIGLYDERMQEMSRMTAPGQIRAAKGKLVEDLCPEIIRLGWSRAGGKFDRLTFDEVRSYPISIRLDYIDSQDKIIADYLRGLQRQDTYRAQVDKHVFIDGLLVLGTECKAFAENAMLKRVLTDFWFLKLEHPELVCSLVQLESQLTGDYSNLRANPRIGNGRSHSLMSHFPGIDLNIVTLLQGERKVNRPIHKTEFYKALSHASLDHAIECFSDLLKPFV